jgi:4-amino-4-deoxy-L-arabinose transferase-like glycosyltransferase
VILLLAAATRLSRSPWRASDLAIVPDSGEYAVGAQRFATLGRYDIEIAGVAYPPRYPPWFSVAVLAPAYWVAPAEIGAGIVPVLLFALAGVWAAFRIGRRLAGEWGGAASAAVLACDMTYGTLSREIMSDVPAAVLVLWGCDLYLKRSQRPELERSSWCAGILGACAGALRVESLAVLLPFVVRAAREREGRALRLLSLLWPSLVLAGATALVQHAAFGDWRRNGYMFWCPVPCDYPRLAFSLENLSMNLKAASHPWLFAPAILGAVGAASLLARGSAPAARLLAFAALAALPGSLVHLFFFFPQTRFNLPLVVLACAIGGAGTVALLPEPWRRRAWFGSVLLGLVPLALPRLPEEEPNRRIIADALAKATPEDAVIVSAIDAVYLEPLVIRGTRRRVVPVSRKVEYASKAVAWKRVDPLDPPARGPLDHRAPGLFRGGAVDVCAFTADEKPELLAAWVREGVPVYVDRSFLPMQFPKREVEALGLELVKDPERPWLSRLAPRR